MKDEEFIPGETYKLAYRSLPHINDIDVSLICPSCGEDKWVYHNKTGVKKLHPDKMKLKCANCGQWFICSRDSLTKALGL